MITVSTILVSCIAWESACLAEDWLESFMHSLCAHAGLQHDVADKDSCAIGTSLLKVAERLDLSRGWVAVVRKREA